MAERHPPGDRWILTNEALDGWEEEQIILTSLTACLNESETSVTRTKTD